MHGTRKAGEHIRIEDAFAIHSDEIMSGVGNILQKDLSYETVRNTAGFDFAQW